MTAEAGRLGWRSVLGFFCLSAGLDVVMARDLIGPVLAGNLYDPDSYMRLVRIREILARHAEIHIVPRDGAGTPTVLHWSHLLDSLLVAMAAPLRLFLDEPSALFVAGVALGPLGIGCLGVALAWALAPLTAPGWRWTAPLLAGVSAPILDYGLPGVVHHHILLALAAVMVAGWCGRANATGAVAGWYAGLWGAVGIWLSPETMPFTLAGFGAMGIGWMQGRPASTVALRAGGTALLLAVAAILAVDPPYGGIGAVQIERVSVVYLALGLATAAIGWALWAIDRARLRPAARIAAGLLTAAIALGIWAALFPSVIEGPNGLMTAEQTKAMFGAIAEMQPVQNAATFLGFLSTGVLAALVLLALAWQRASWLWLYAASCAAVAVALGAWHVRFATYPACFGAAALPLAITLATAAVAKPTAQSFARIGSLALFLLLPLGAAFGGAMDNPMQAATTGEPTQCPLDQSVSLLAPFAGQIVLADPSESPELLYRTGMQTVGSLYDNVESYMRAWAAWRSPPSTEMPDAVRATHATLILACPNTVATDRRSALAADLPADTLFDRLARGDPPRWLRRIGADPGGHVLYAISGNPT